MRTGKRPFLALAAAVALTSAAGPAFADIQAFNAAVQKHDFQAATAEASLTWPTLDRERPDIVAIAREFGFVAYLAGDMQAAKTYASFVVETTAGAADQVQQRAAALVLLRLAEMKLDPASKAARDLLVEALNARAQDATDNISYLGADALVGGDFQAGRWADAEQSATLAMRLTASSPAFLDARRRFEIYGQAAQYMRTKDKDAYYGMVAVQNRLAADVDNAADEAQAARLAVVFWQARAWAEAMEGHLASRNVSLARPRPGEADPNAMMFPRRASIPHDRADRLNCPTRMEMAKLPQYPPSAQFAGFVGAVILKVDIDDKGMASNPVVLSAVPEAEFGRTALASVGDIRIKPRPGYLAAECSLTQKDRVIEYLFTFDQGKSR